LKQRQLFEQVLVQLQQLLAVNSWQMYQMVLVLLCRWLPLVGWYHQLVCFHRRRSMLRDPQLITQAGLQQEDSYAFRLSF
jgi:hypothetical protein